MAKQKFFKGQYVRYDYNIWVIDDIVESLVDDEPYAIMTQIDTDIRDTAPLCELVVY